MPLMNAMESIVEEIFSEFQTLVALKCTCDQCKRDIIALVLNQIPSRYVSSEAGEAYVNAAYMDKQLRLDIMRELFKASIVVRDHPRH